MRTPIYKIYELRDDVTNTIENVKKTVEEESKLVDFIKSNNKAEDFKNLVPGLEEEIKNQTDGIAIMTSRLNSINAFLESYNTLEGSNKEFTDNLIINLFDSIGLVRKEELQDKEQDTNA